MSVESLPPVPMPPGQRWKHFRQAGLPALAFVLVLMVAVWLWGANLASPLVMGQAESLLAEVTSPVDGEVMTLDVQLYQQVYAGDLLAVVASAQPDVLSNTLSVIRAEMDAALAEATFAPSDQIRLAGLQLEWLDLKGEVAALRANLPYTDAELTRIEKLCNQGIADQSQLELARANALQVREEISGKEKAIAIAEAALLRLDPEGDNNSSKYVQAQLRLATEQLRLAESELKPTVLRAPLSGHVTRLYVQANAAVNRRQPLMTIADSRVERIIGYIPQPVRIEPKIGMSVEVRSRSSDRTTALSTVVNVGPRIELFDAPLRVRGMGAAQERGLPVVVNVPPGMNLRPGELVDLRLITD
jgi:multidrug resistance efflux pump